MKNMVSYVPPKKQVEGYIERKSMANKSNVEYADRCMNPVQSCAHNCTYCYAKDKSKFFGHISSDEEWCHPKIVSNTLELLAKEIPKMQPGTSVHLSFMTDAFMYGYPEISKLSLQAIAMLNNAGIKVTTLTKGLLPIELANFSRENEYGITLVSLDENFRRLYEPGAAPLIDRLAALWALHQAGCKTWVSIEPYFPDHMYKQELRPLLEAISFVDKIVFGRLNHCAEVTVNKNYKQFYNEKAAEVIQFCQERGIICHIKDGTITC